SVVLPWSTWAMMAMFRTSVRRMKLGKGEDDRPDSRQRLAILPSRPVSRYGDDFNDTDIVAKGSFEQVTIDDFIGKSHRCANLPPRFCAPTVLETLWRSELRCAHRERPRRPTTLVMRPAKQLVLRV